MKMLGFEHCTVSSEKKVVRRSQWPSHALGSLLGTGGREVTIQGSQEQGGVEGPPD